MSSHEIEEVETEDNDSNDARHTAMDTDYQSFAPTSSNEDNIAQVDNIAGQSDNELYSGIADDHLDGGVGDDDIFGDDGDDILIAGFGNDYLEGGDGNDEIDGDEGDDEIHAGIGDDHLDGGDGDDSLFGDDGDDVLRAGFGNDILTGGAGLDDFTFYAAGDFKVTDYNTTDDNLVFDSATTGLHDLDDLLGVITSISETAEGVLIEFGQVATITLIGLTTADLNAGMVHFV